MLETSNLNSIPGLAGLFGEEKSDPWQETIDERVEALKNHIKARETISDYAEGLASQATAMVAGSIVNGILATPFGLAPGLGLHLLLGVVGVGTRKKQSRLLTTAVLIVTLLFSVGTQVKPILDNHVAVSEMRYRLGESQGTNMLLVVMLATGSTGLGLVILSMLKR